MESMPNVKVSREPDGSCITFHGWPEKSHRIITAKLSWSNHKAHLHTTEGGQKPHLPIGGVPKY